MLNKQYELQYLPMFYKDLQQKVDYIADCLHNPQAALELINDVEEAILDRSTCAESFEPYRSAQDREHPYYAIYVKNYVVYYVVLDNSVMEVRRLLYERQDREAVL